MKRSLILILVMLAAFCFIEAVARVVLGLGSPPLSTTDPEIEYMFKPNQDVMRFGNRQLFNAYGMRNENFPKEKPDGEYRILCFGDSVLNGGSLTDHSRLATTLLEEELEKEWKQPVLVANISAGSWGPGNMLAYIRKFGLFDADYIIVQVSSHDIGDVPTFEPLSAHTHPTDNPCCATWEGITRYAPRYVPQLKSVLRSKNKSKKKSYTQDEREQRYTQSLEALSDIHKLAIEQGAKCMILLHSERKEIETGIYREGHDRFIEWARAHEVNVLNLGPAEAESLNSAVDPYRKGDNIHLSNAGQQVMYEQLYIHFRELRPSPDA